MYQAHEPVDPTLVLQAEPFIEEPVPKSERFVEDFDRSWPRGRPVPIIEPSAILPRRSEGDKVLFNASLNRLETTSNRQAQPQPQPRLMSRLQPPLAEVPAKLATPAARLLDRPLPPHLPATSDGGRMLPPHMTALPSIADPKPSSGSAAPSTARQPWGLQREVERQPSPTSIVERQELLPPTVPSHNSPSPPQPISNLPSRPPATHSMAPQPFPPAPSKSSQTAFPLASAAASIPAAPPQDQQTAEMHSAAEKARLRRLAEEAEREAAAERARRKARELEERLGLKAAAASDNKAVKASPIPAAPPGLTQTVPTPTFTLAVRPKPAMENASTPFTSVKAVPAIAGLPPRPSGDARLGETSWRGRIAASEVVSHGVPSAGTTEGAQASMNDRPPRPTAESFLGPQSSQVQPSEDIARSQPLLLQDTLHAAGLPSKPSSAIFAEAEPAATLPADAELLLPKRGANFDGMLARIQAAMAEARASPPILPPLPPNGVEEEQISHFEQLPNQLPQKPIALSASPSAPPPLPAPREPSPPPPQKPTPPVVQEYFNVTQTLPPKSPPPVWRTFAVKTPKSTKRLSPIPTSRTRADESPSKEPPKGWLMSFEPPIDHLSYLTLSRADLLLPQPLQRRFAKHVDVGPLVSISPRRFENFSRRKGKKNSDVVRPHEVVVPTSAVESLLPSLNPITTGSTAPSRQLRMQRTQAGDDSRWRVDPSMRPGDSADASGRKSRSPVKVSPAVKAEKNGTFAVDGLEIGLSERGRIALEMKPGVRFMVSSELEGDSLLDEVNKMSLEAVGEGEDKGDVIDLAMEGGSKTPGTAVSFSRYRFKTID